MDPARGQLHLLLLVLDRYLSYAELIDVLEAEFLYMHASEQLLGLLSVDQVMEQTE